MAQNDQLIILNLNLNKIFIFAASKNFNQATSLLCTDLKSLGTTVLEFEVNL